MHPGNIICQRVKAEAEDPLLAALSKIRRLFESVWSKQTVIAEDDDDATRDEKFRLVLIDAGLASHLDSADRRNFIDLFHAVVTNDGARAGQLMIERSASQSCLHPEQFKSTMKQLIEDVHR